MRIAHFFLADTSLGTSTAVSNLLSTSLLQIYKTNHLLVYIEKRNLEICPGWCVSVVGGSACRQKGLQVGFLVKDTHLGCRFTPHL